MNNDKLELFDFPKPLNVIAGVGTILFAIWSSFFIGSLIPLEDYRWWCIPTIITLIAYAIVVIIVGVGIINRGYDGF